MEEQFAAQSIAHFLENHMSSGARKIEAIADGPECFLVPKKPNGHKQLFFNRHSFPPGTITGLHEPWKCPQLLNNQLHSSARQPEVAPKVLHHQSGDSCAKIVLSTNSLSTEDRNRCGNDNKLIVQVVFFLFTLLFVQYSCECCMQQLAVFGADSCSSLVFLSGQAKPRHEEQHHSAALSLYACQAKKNLPARRPRVVGGEHTYCTLIDARSTFHNGAFAMETIPRQAKSFVLNSTIPIPVYQPE